MPPPGAGLQVSLEPGAGMSDSLGATSWAWAAGTGVSGCQQLGSPEGVTRITVPWSRPKPEALVSVMPGGSKWDSVSYNPAGLLCGKVVCLVGGREDGSSLMGKPQEELG